MAEKLSLQNVIDQLKANKMKNTDELMHIRSSLVKIHAHLTKDARKEAVQKSKDLEKSRENKNNRATKTQGKTQKRDFNLGPLGGLLAGGGIGLGAVGAGIGAFFMGLAGADAIINKFGTGESLKKLLVNMAEGLAAFSTRDMIAIGSLLGAGALFGAMPGASGVGAGIGVGMMGVGIAAFFSALAAGDMAIGAMESTGENLATFLGNLADGLSKLSTSDMITLGGLMAAGGAMGAFFGIGKTGKMAAGIALMGAGIAGFFGALGAGSMALDLMQTTGEKLPAFLGNLGEGIGALGDKNLIMIAGLMAAGGAMAAFFGVGKTGKVAVGMALMGAGISAGLASMAGITDLASQAGFDGSGFKTIATNIAEGLGAFDNSSLIWLSGAIAAGGALGALFGPTTVAKAAVGMVAVGLGIGGFLSSLAITTDFAAVIGADGGGFKKIATNIADGLTAFNTVDDGIGDKVKAIAGIGPSIALLFAGTGLGALTDTVISTGKKALNFLFGTDFETNQDTARANQFTRLVDSLEPLKNIDASVGTKLDKVGSGLRNFYRSLKDVGDLDAVKVQENFVASSQALAAQVNILDAALNGGSITTGKGTLFNKLKTIRFNTPLLDLPLSEMASAFKKVQTVFGQTVGGGPNVSGNATDRAVELNLLREIQQTLAGGITVINQDNSSNSSNNSSTAIPNNVPGTENVSDGYNIGPQ